MKEQNFSNHTRVHPLFHYFLLPATVLLFAVALVITILDFSWPMLLVSLTFVFIHLTAFIARDYAKKNQDRIIRAELRLRYYILTNQDFHTIEHTLSIGQMAALRFAPNEEFLRLTAKRELSDLTPKQIKQSIMKWEPDNLRV